MRFANAIGMEALEDGSSPAAAAGQQTWDHLLLQHPPQLARHARGEEERARPISSAKPQAVPIGLSIISAVAGSIACLRLFGGMMRLRLVKKASIFSSHSSFSTSSTPAA